MKHIVFVIGYYYPEAGSTSLCAIRVMNELKKKDDVEISCICGTSGSSYFDQSDDIDIYKMHHFSFSDRIEKCNTSAKRAFAKVSKNINDALHIKDYPDMDKKYSMSIYRTLLEIENKKHIDAIVGVYMPKQAISGVLLFKKAYPRVYSIAYFLDTLRSNRPKLLPSAIHQKRIDKYEKEIFSVFDKIILMKYGKQYYSNLLCDRYKRKICFLGLPSLEMMDLMQNRNPGMKCSYIGTTYSDIRNPIFAMTTFDMAHRQNSKIVFNIYGPSNMKKELKKWQSDHSNCFYYHDFVNHKEIRKVYENTDYIVSIGNQLKGVVPGKTFEIFGTLKPIIHFTDGINDSSLEYINQYPNVCVINYGMSIEEATATLLDFLNRPYSYCERSIIESQFYYATPKAVTDLIYESIC